MSKKKAYGLIVEWPGQDPILLESEGKYTSRAACIERAKRLHSRPVRWCVVRLKFEAGNELLLRDLGRLQKPVKPVEPPF